MVAIKSPRDRPGTAKIAVALIATAAVGGFLFVWQHIKTIKFETTRNRQKAEDLNVQFLADILDLQEKVERHDDTMKDLKHLKEEVANLKQQLEFKSDNWKVGLVTGDGENSLDSYHAFDHRPPGNDKRDAVLRNFEMVECPNKSTEHLVTGQDVRYVPGVHDEYKERNPKFLCGVDALHSPCVMYSFGSYDEISYEVGFDRITKSACDVHVFDPGRIPDAESAKRYNFHTHHIGVGGVDKTDTNPIIKTVQTIMSELNHTRIDVFKIDIEGHEASVLPNIQDVYPNIGQISIEFHSVEYLKTGMELLTKAGFVSVFARREDRCGVCTEVTLVNTKWKF